MHYAIYGIQNIFFSLTMEFRYWIYLPINFKYELRDADTSQGSGDNQIDIARILLLNDTELASNSIVCIQSTFFKHIFFPNIYSLDWVPFLPIYG